MSANESRDILYRTLLRHAMLRTVFLYFIPLLLLTLFFHIQHNFVLRDIEIRHRQALAQHQAGNWSPRKIFSNTASGFFYSVSPCSGSGLSWDTGNGSVFENCGGKTHK